MTQSSSFIQTGFKMCLQTSGCCERYIFKEAHLIHFHSFHLQYMRVYLMYPSVTNVFSDIYTQFPYHSFVESFSRLSPAAIRRV